MLLAGALGALLATACGKVGDPLPPIVETPEPVTDLAVAQAGYDLRFDWTNPTFYVDAAPAIGLTEVRIRADGELVLTVAASGPGERQSTLMRDVRGLIGTSPAFSIEVRGSGALVSAPSPPVRLGIVEVPGPVGALRGLADREVVALAWDPPSEGPERADLFRVYRTTEVAGEVPSGATAFEDRSYRDGETYAYRVVGVRITPDGQVEGVSSPPVEVIAVDLTPPSAPTGLRSRRVGDSALLTWDPGPEADIAGYRVFRQAGPGAPLVPMSDEPVPSAGYEDSSPGPEVVYRVAALDRSGNASAMSEPSVEP